MFILKFVLALAAITLAPYYLGVVVDRYLFGIQSKKDIPDILLNWLGGLLTIVSAFFICAIAGGIASII